MKAWVAVIAMLMVLALAYWNMLLRPKSPFSGQDGFDASEEYPEDLVGEEDSVTH